MGSIHKLSETIHTQLVSCYANRTIRFNVVFNGVIY